MTALASPVSPATPPQRASSFSTEQGGSVAPGYGAPAPKGHGGVPAHAGAPVAAAADRTGWYVCLSLLLVGALLSVLPLWAPLLLACWLAILVRPLHSWLSQRVRGSSSAAAVITVLLVLVALTPMVLVGLSLFASAVDIFKDVQRSGNVQQTLQGLLSAEPSSGTSKWDLQQAMDLARQHGGGALNAASLIFGAAAHGAIALFVFVFGFYTCLVDGRRGHAWLLDHAPMPRENIERLAAAWVETGRGLLLGVGLTALIQGGVATAGYVIIGVPQALVLGLVTIFAALIPSVGTGLVWVPVSIGLFLANRSGAAAAMVGLGVVVSIADNFVRPWLSRHAHLDLSTFALFVAMLGGIATFGAWGLLAGPLFVRLAVEGLRLYRESREARSRVILDAAGALPARPAQS